MYETLYWYPFEPAKHLARIACLSIEARAAYDSLRQHAWLAGQRGERPASLPNDDAQLARLSNVGRKWPGVRLELQPYYDVEGDRLVDRELLVVWEHSVKSYERHSTAGRKGGRPRRTEKPRESEAKAKLRQSQSELEQEVKGTPFRGAPLPARQRQLRLEKHGRDESDDGAEQSIPSTEQLEARQRQVAAWETENPVRAQQFRQNARSKLAVPEGKVGPSRFIQATYEEMVLADAVVEQDPTGSLALLEPRGDATKASHVLSRTGRG